MRIIFENIRTSEQVMVDVANHGQLEARAIIAAYVNSSDMGRNGKKTDAGWRLVPEQMMLVKQWMEDREKTEAISRALSIPVEDLQVYDYVTHLIDQATTDPNEKVRLSEEFDEAERAYRDRVKALAEGTVIETPRVEAVEVVVPEPKVEEAPKAEPELPPADEADEPVEEKPEPKAVEEKVVDPKPTTQKPAPKKK